MPHHIRALRPDDLDEAVRCVRLHDSDDARHALRDLERYLARCARAAPTGARFYVAEDRDEERVVGVCGWQADRGEGEGICWLGWFYVNPFFRRRGIGAALFRRVLDDLLPASFRKLYVDTSALPKYAPAVAFYRGVGFELEGRLRDYYGPGEDMLILGMTLAR